MKEVTVELPISGTLSVVVEVEDEADAIEAALNSDQISYGNIQEWDAHEHLMMGNVWLGTGSPDAQIVDVYDLDDDDS